MVNVVERIVDVELQLGAAAQLVTRLLGELVAYAALVLVDVIHNLLSTLAGEDAQANIGDAQVWRNAYAAHADECPTCLGGLAAEDLAQFLLYQTADFLLSCCIHYIDCLSFCGCKGTTFSRNSRQSS